MQTTITIEVNNRKVQARAGETVLLALRRAGIRIPTLCYVEGLSPTGACRLCVVEVSGQRNLVPSCAFPVTEGMRIQTHSPRVMRARKTVVELLLASHPDDCNYCIRGGNCELQRLAEELGVRQRRYVGQRSDYHVDLSDPAIVRDPAKCILCGRCVRVCEEVQSVSAIDFIGRGSGTRVGTVFGQGLNVSSCIRCGQCIMACPTGALREHSHAKRVVDALRDPDRFVVVQHAPAMSVTLAEEFGFEAGTDTCGVMAAALRALGFDRVFETSFAADLTIMEEASELVQRLDRGGPLPMMTSCSPGWVSFVEQFHPEFIANLSTCKSPQQMLGAVIKTYFAEREGLAPEKIFSVAVMPCTAKKYEAERPEMARRGVADVDAVLTTRELARLIRLYGIDQRRLDPEPADTPFGDRSTAGKLFGASGGVMESAIRTAFYLLTGKEAPKLEVQAVRGLEGVKRATIDIEGRELAVAAVSGLANAGRLLKRLQAGLDRLDFIEVMTCPGGCVGGGGQLFGVDPDAVRKRMQALYRIDRDEPVRTAHGNAAVRRLYDEFLGQPLGSKSHELLHTRYAERAVVH